MFEDTKEGQTHYFGDGHKEHPLPQGVCACGKPINPETQKKIDEKFENRDKVEFPDPCICGCHTSEFSSEDMKKNGCENCAELCHLSDVKVSTTPDGWEKEFWKLVKSDGSQELKVCAREMLNFIRSTIQVDRSIIREIKLS